MGQTEISMITNRNLALTDAYNTVLDCQLTVDDVQVDLGARHGHGGVGGRPALVLAAVGGPHRLDRQHGGVLAHGVRSGPGLGRCS